MLAVPPLYHRPPRPTVPSGPRVVSSLFHPSILLMPDQHGLPPYPHSVLPTHLTQASRFVGANLQSRVYMVNG